MRLIHIFVCNLVLCLLVVITSSCGARLSSSLPAEKADSSLVDTTDSQPITRSGSKDWQTEWSQQLREIIRQDNFIQKSMPPDFAEYVCPKYFSLNDSFQLEAVVHFFSAIAQAETDFDPYSRYFESTMGVDATTHQHVYSEGLLQLSYQDGSTYGCDFSWPNDRILSARSPQKTIFDSRKQFACGVRILHFQIAHLNRVFPSHPHYWAVLRPASGRFPVVKRRMKQFSACY